MRLRMMCDGGGTVISIKLVQPQPVIRSSANTATGHTLDTLEAIIESNSHAIQATTTRQNRTHNLKGLMPPYQLPTNIIFMIFSHESYFGVTFMRFIIIIAQFLVRHLRIKNLDI